jgi:hypothetical protein
MEQSNAQSQLAHLKSIIDEKWKANEAVLKKTLPYGTLTWRQRKDGDFEVTIKAEL